MYKQLKIDDFRKVFKLPQDYTVSGFLCHGTWKREDEILNIKNALSELDIDYKINTFSNFLQRMIEINVNGKRYWFDFSYGGAMLSEYLHIACLFGSKKNILIGSCGGLSTKIKSCDCIIPTWVYGNESSTRMYSLENKNNKHFPNEALIKKLKSNVPSEIKIHDGPTMTCQAMLAESWDDVQTWSKDGYLGVEMEASTVFSVSNFFKVPSVALLVVGDNLIKKENVMHENFQKSANQRYKIKRDLLKVSLKELLEI
ncbi:MAG: hypothetical protein ACD_19C00432G0013 [uncultured bacterium]|nr:MAG: hypothetical protein ACD_19C00432G0013 [uncultured bacterium]